MMTLTIAPPNEITNGTQNTFIVALGLKGNKEGWEAMERQFEKDMSAASDPENPIKVYNGKTRKICGAIMPQIISMEDRVERADSCHVLAFGSPFHRYTGKSVNLEKPHIKVDQIKEFLKKNKQGGLEVTEAGFGWSNAFVDRSANGGVLPSCNLCRTARLIRLGTIASSSTEIDTVILAVASHRFHEECTDWNVTEATASRLEFAPPSGYPMTSAPNCPVEPHPLRKPGLERLQYVPTSFELLKTSIRVAFHNCSQPGRGNSWNKDVCCAFLRASGVAPVDQKRLYDAAKKHRRQPTVALDYNSNDGIGDFQFPAPWCGRVPLDAHLECIMHQTQLGQAESNSVLIDKWMATVGKAVNSFRRDTNVFLEDLKGYQLANFPVLKFGGSDGKLTTGSWVSENWLAYTRVSKFVFIRLVCLVEDDFLGAPNVSRLVISFVAMMARLLSHSGVDQAIMEATELYMKEFMSCVRELDLQVRPEELAPGRFDEDKRDAWWYKSNYISSFNLLDMQRDYGPLVNLWDGGGKGEKKFPEVKAHLPRGIRPKESSFFVNLQKRCYKLHAMKVMLEDLLGPDNASKVSVSLADETDGDDTDAEKEASDDEECNEDGNDGNNDSGGEDDETATVHEAEHCYWQETMMKKARTIHVFRNHEKFLAAFNEHKLFPTIVTIETDNSGTGKAVYSMRCVFRMPGRSFGWRKVNFDDENGCYFNGLYFAPIALGPVSTADCPQSVEEIQATSQMAAIVIPLCYVLGHDHEDGYKYCVLTNFWKERTANGDYALPGLDSTLYN
jgi:hypothetical protein